MAAIRNAWAAAPCAGVYLPGRHLAERAKVPDRVRLDARDEVARRLGVPGIRHALHPGRAAHQGERPPQHLGIANDQRPAERVQCGVVPAQGDDLRPDAGHVPHGQGNAR